MSGYNSSMHRKNRILTRLNKDERSELKKLKRLKRRTFPQELRLKQLLKKLHGE